MSKFVKSILANILTFCAKENNMSFFKEFLKAGTYIAKETVKADSVQKSDEYQEKRRKLLNHIAM